MNQEIEEGQQSIVITVSAEVSGQRADVFLTSQLPDLTRTHVQKLIADGSVTVNAKKLKAHYKVEAGDTVALLLPEPVQGEVIAENLPLDILYEDEVLIVVNKARGMVVHPAPGNYQGTLVNALLYHCKNLSGINGVIRPGIVHRLDKDTTGVMVVAKTDQAHLSLSKQIQDRSASREYFAVVYGTIGEERGLIDAPIGRHQWYFKIPSQPLPGFGLSNGFGGLHLSPANCKLVGLIKFGSTWLIFSIPLWLIRFMDQREIPFQLLFQVRLCILLNLRCGIQ
jgi:23S rRNA pseudouridine1911/1915/1917 synthase